MSRAVRPREARHGLVGAAFLTLLMVAWQDDVPADAGEPPRGPNSSELDWSQLPPEPLHVVIISEDGLRPDALLPEYAPRHLELMAEGAVARDATTIEQAYTLPSHASMLSGVPAEMHL